VRQHRHELVFGTVGGFGGGSGHPLVVQELLPFPLTATEIVSRGVQRGGDVADLLDRRGLSGGGTVPETLVVPARYVPEVPGGLIGVRLIQIRTISFPPERGNYFGTVSVQIRLHWTVRVTESEPSKGAG
jgi:hypothetical protein